MIATVVLLTWSDIEHTLTSHVMMLPATLLGSFDLVCVSVPDEPVFMVQLSSWLLLASKIAKVPLAKTRPSAVSVIVIGNCAE